MKKAIYTFGLLSLVMVLTSFSKSETTTSEKGDNSIVEASSREVTGKNVRLDMAGRGATGKNVRLD